MLFIPYSTRISPILHLHFFLILLLLELGVTLLLGNFEVNFGQRVGKQICGFNKAKPGRVELLFSFTIRSLFFPPQKKEGNNYTIVN